MQVFILDTNASFSSKKYKIEGQLFRVMQLLKHVVFVNTCIFVQHSCDNWMNVGGGEGDSLIKVGTDVWRVQNLVRAKFPKKT